jgi:hypothetical protein
MCFYLNVEFQGQSVKACQFWTVWAVQKLATLEKYVDKCACFAWVTVKTEFICATLITVKRTDVRDVTEHSSVFCARGSQSTLPSEALHYLHSLVRVHLVTSVAVVYSSLAWFPHFTVLCISILYVLLTSCHLMLLLPSNCSLHTCCTPGTLPYSGQSAASSCLILLQVSDASWMFRLFLKCSWSCGSVW